MDIELGIANVARPVTFEHRGGRGPGVTEAIESALVGRNPDQADGRQGPSHHRAGERARDTRSLGSETKHAVGFGAL